MFGIHHRGDFDLKNHGKMERFDLSRPFTNEDFIPLGRANLRSFGVDRAILSF